MRRLVVLGAVISLVAILAGVAKYHVVTGSNVEFVKLIPKKSMTFSETFVNLDALGGMPEIVARSNYPMFMGALDDRLAATQKTRAAPPRRCALAEVGMTRSQVLVACGAPDMTDTPSSNEQVMNWNGGGMVRLIDDKVVFASQ